MKIAVLIVHFGGLPQWFDVWKKSAELNSSIDFHVFTDQPLPPGNGNVIGHFLTLDDFNRLTCLKEFGLTLSRPYKICDFRPLFGRIFVDYLKTYDYWGWGDLDVFYGNILKCLGGRFGVYDYISTGWNGESGPLAFLRNSASVNDIFFQIERHIEKINDCKYHGLDEIDFVEMLKRNVKCDIIFRECRFDLPALLSEGHIFGITSRKEYVLYHFGGRFSHARKSIVQNQTSILKAMDAREMIYIARNGDVQKGNGGLRELFRRAVYKISAESFRHGLHVKKSGE